MSEPRPLVFVISPQRWSGFQVSKHHYARALASRGWRVVFIDPPADLGSAGHIELRETDVIGICELRYQTFFPYKLKFRARFLFDLLMRHQARLIVRAAGQPDLVWDFDNTYQFRDLRSFGANEAWFHLVDDVAVPGLGTKGADHVFYLHQSFCELAGGVPLPSHEIPHGLSRVHARAAALAEEVGQSAETPHVGFVGNLAAAWIDWAAIGEMLRRHPEAQFSFWGPLPDHASAEPSLRRILDHPAAHFAGLKSPEEIVAESQTVDVWLLPFRHSALLGGALNSHKVLEYLSTGRAIVMNWLEAYDQNELVYSLPKASDQNLADLLDQVIGDLATANAPEVVARRRTFALERTYDTLVSRVFSIADQPASITRVGRPDAA